MAILWGNILTTIGLTFLGVAVVVVPIIVLIWWYKIRKIKNKIPEALKTKLLQEVNNGEQSNREVEREEVGRETYREYNRGDREFYPGSRVPGTGSEGRGQEGMGSDQGTAGHRNLPLPRLDSEAAIKRAIDGDSGRVEDEQLSAQRPRKSSKPDLPSFD